MSAVQFNTYAKFYDLLYKDKDYAREAAYIDSLINKYVAGVPKQDLSVLDLACGTGKHLRELAGLGYGKLSGSDISEAMIEVARSKVSEVERSIDFFNYSFQEADKISGTFDVVLSMFSAVNYITSLEDQVKTLKNIHGLLQDKGLFIFDYWNGNAVVRDYSPVKVLRKKENNAEIIRISETNIDTIKQDAFVKFSCLYFESQALQYQFEELHHLHYYHFSEMQNLLKIAGFELVHMSPFMELQNPVQPYDWNISIVARKVNKA